MHRPPFSFILFVFKMETFVKSVDTSACINQLLLAGEKRMTFRADINTKIRFGGTGFKCFAARTSNRCCFILWMDAFFHNIHPFQKNLITNFNISFITYVF